MDIYLIPLNVYYIFNSNLDSNFCHAYIIAKISYYWHSSQITSNNGPVYKLCKFNIRQKNFSFISNYSKYKSIFFNISTLAISYLIIRNYQYRWLILYYSNYYFLWLYIYYNSHILQYNSHIHAYIHTYIYTYISLFFFNISTLVANSLITRSHQYGFILLELPHLNFKPTISSLITY